MLFGKRKVFVFAALLYQGFLLEEGRTVEMFVGVWSVTWPLGIITAALFYSVEAAWHKPLCLQKSFPLHKVSKIKENWSSVLISKRKCHFTLNVPQQRSCGGEDCTLDRFAGPSQDTRLNFAPNLNARYHICKAPQHVRSERHTSAVTLTQVVSGGLPWWGCRIAAQTGTKDGLWIMWRRWVTIERWICT